MRNIVVLFLILTTIVFGLEGPDFMLLGDFYSPLKSGFNLVSSNSSDNPISAVFGNASLYGISSLRWYYGGAVYQAKYGSIGFCWRDYGIKNLYSSTEARLFIQKAVLKRLAVGIGYSHTRFEYGDNVYNAGNDYLFANAAAHSGDLGLFLQIDKIALNRRIKSLDKRPEFILLFSWQAETIITFDASLYRDSQKRMRLRAGQDLQLAKPLTLSAGFLTGPQVYYFGLEFVYKRLAFGYTYYDVGDMPNCSKITMSYR
jgi:hypothetical protein